LEAIKSKKNKKTLSIENSLDDENEELMKQPSLEDVE